MKSFSEFTLHESFRNFIGDKSIEDRKKWSNQAYKLLTAAYSGKTGGIKGSGFTSEEDMIQNIPFWKLYTRGDKIVAAVFYKDKGGRKMVAAATDGSRDSKSIFANILHADFNVAWGEVSKAMLIFILMNLPIPFIKGVLLPIEEVRKLIDDELLEVTPKTLELLGEFDKKLYKRYSKILSEFFYIRKIGSEYFIKIAIGKPNQTIK